MQVADHADLSTAELIAKVDEIGPRAARWRAKAPALFRKMPMKEEVGGEPETWRMGYLLDVILTRDPWMHRVDIARATGREMVLTPEHDGRIVADVVAEWARRHGQPFTLTSTGPAGGDVRRRATAASDITIDAVEFCRTLSGRADGHRPAHPGGSVLMETRVTEVADGIHQLTTFVGRADFGFNQYLIAADEPLLFHTGMRQLFPLVSARRVEGRCPVGVAALDQLRPRRGRRVRLDERLARASRRRPPSRRA